ncbi:hypothetical protein [Chamaesiphon sp.]|uniref:hypothetical protein n=1 Tax=Chamaesiphon sp. TaxID=2814140 RepID=UPI003593913D
MKTHIFSALQRQIRGFEHTRIDSKSDTIVISKTTIDAQTRCYFRSHWRSTDCERVHHIYIAQLGANMHFCPKF